MGLLILHLLAGSPACVKFCKLGQRRLENMVKSFAQMRFAYGRGHESYIYFGYTNLNFFMGLLILHLLAGNPTCTKFCKLG